MLHVVLALTAWYGPATATFAVQFAGDPYDPKRNDVRVRFVGDKDQREERPAWFDPALGAWRASLFTEKDGRYRAVLVRNGKALQIDPEEGLLDLFPAPSLGYLTASAARPDRLGLDTGDPWVGLGAELGADLTPARVDAVADAGANWVRVVPPADPFADDALVRFGAAMDEIERRGLTYTLASPTSPSEAWGRYALARFAPSPRLVGWEGAYDPRARPTAVFSWDALFENRPGPFVVGEKETGRLKALRAVIERSGWGRWDSSRAWKGTNAKGVAESDRLILMAAPGAKLVGLPLADGTYDLVTLDPATGVATTGQARIEHAALSLPIPAERFFVLRRRL